MGYANEQKKWVKKHDVRFGDFVRVISNNNIYQIINFYWDCIWLSDGFRYNHDKLQKITDLKELAPFYIEIKNEEQFIKVLNIMLYYELGDDAHLCREIECPTNYNYKGGFWSIGRQLTYEQILRFEKKQEEKELYSNISEIEDLQYLVRSAKDFIIKVEEKIKELKNNS
jgi:hypothetical protein